MLLFSHGHLRALVLILDADSIHISGDASVILVLGAIVLGIIRYVMIKYLEAKKSKEVH